MEGLSLLTTANLVFLNPYAFTLLLFPQSVQPELVAGDLFIGECTEAHLSIKEGPLVLQIPRLMLILYSLASKKATLLLVVGRGFISGFPIPPVFHRETEPLAIL